MLDLAGAASLLMWGLHMVKTGVKRSLGFRLHRWMAVGTGNRLLAFGVGLAATTILQSSTSTAIMAASFVGGGFLNSLMAQSIMLGANVGTSLVAWMLTFDVSWVAPLLIVSGVIGFAAGRTKTGKNGARALIGLGLMLLALRLLGQAAAPMQGSRVLIALMGSLDEVPVLAAFIGALLAMASSSSLVVVLFVMSLSATGTIGPGLSIAMVLGANVGGAIPPILATLGEGVHARRAMVGNLLVRMLGCMAVLPLADGAARLLQPISRDPSELVINAHVTFNVLLAVLALPMLTPFAILMQRILPAKLEADQPFTRLDPAILDKPAMALAVAARETLRIGDCVATMLSSNLEALRHNDASRYTSIADMDNEIDEINSAVKFYLAKLNYSTLPEKDEKRSSAIIAYATDLEHAGDIIERNLRDLVKKKIRGRLSFSHEGHAEIEEIYRATLDNIRVAQAILISGDGSLARQLVEAKVNIRHLEKNSVRNHLNRLRAGRIESVQTSSLHLDMLRDLKRINAHVATVAYPILMEAGEISESRLIGGRTTS